MNRPRKSWRKRCPKNRLSAFFREKDEFGQAVDSGLATIWETMAWEKKDEGDFPASILLIGKVARLCIGETVASTDGIPAMFSAGFAEYAFRVWQNELPVDGDVCVGIVCVDWPFVVVQSIYGGDSDGWWYGDCSVDKRAKSNGVSIKLSRIEGKVGDSEKWHGLVDTQTSHMIENDIPFDLFDSNAIVDLLPRLRADTQFVVPFDFEADG